MKDIDFLAIGDITTDAFILMKDANVHCKINSSDCELCVRFGDKVPFESVTECAAVGNSPNAAVSAARLGLSVSLLASMGTDRNGDICIATLEKNNVDTSLIHRQSDLPTNYHYVLWYPPERTILVHQNSFSYSLPDIGTPKWIYLSSMGEASEQLHHDLATYLGTHPTVKLAFQPGTFQMKMGTEKLRDIYTRTELFICNVEESKRILNTEESDIKKLLSAIRTLGPRYVVITDGPKGAYGFDGEKYLFMPPYPDPKEPLERTGAGDAFASTFAVALSLGKTFEEAFALAPINSMSVVQYVGAQEGLLSMDKLESFLSQASKDYKIKEI